MNITNLLQAEQSAEKAVKPHIRTSVAYSDHDVELMWDQGLVYIQRVAALTNTASRLKRIICIFTRTHQILHHVKYSTL